jgi:hypothetical protein
VWVAGDWIKVETCTAGKAEIIRLARILSMSHREALGAVVQFWSWADSNTVDGLVDGVALQDVDAVLSCPGLCAALEMVGWLQVDKEKERIRIPKFARHNGESAKKRALTNRRQAKWRNAVVDGDASTKASTREEKRRVKNKTAPPNGGSTIWDFGRALLIEQGLTATSAGALMGSWLREWSEAEVADALRSAAGKADVRSYVAAILKTKTKKGSTAELKVAMP